MSSVGASGRFNPVVGVARSAVVAAVERDLREQMEKDEEKNKVRRFVERRRKRKKIFEV